MNGQYKRALGSGRGSISLLLFSLLSSHRVELSSHGASLEPPPDPSPLLHGSVGAALGEFLFAFLIFSWIRAPEMENGALLTVIRGEVRERQGRSLLRDRRRQ